MKYVFYLLPFICLSTFAAQEQVIYVKDLQAKPHLLPAPIRPVHSAHYQALPQEDEQMIAYLNARNARVWPNLSCKEKCCICGNICFAVIEGCALGLAKGIGA